MLRQALNWLQQRVLQPATIGIRIERRGGAYAAAGLKVVIAHAQALASGAACRRRGLERLGRRYRVSGRRSLRALCPLSLLRLLRSSRGRT